MLVIHVSLWFLFNSRGLFLETFSFGLLGSLQNRAKSSSELYSPELFSSDIDKEFSTHLLRNTWFSRKLEFHSSAYNPVQLHRGIAS